MKKIIIISIIFLHSSSLFGQLSDSIFISSDSTYKISKELSRLFEISNKSKADSVDFFKCFPSTFSLFKAIYDYGGPLYEESYFHIEFLFSYASIDSIHMIDKLIEISIGGKWDADAINYLSTNIRDFVNSHTSATVNVLQNKSEIECFSFWLFIFDSPHPSNLREDFNMIYTKVLVQNVSQANLLRKAYESLIESETQH